MKMLAVVLLLASVLPAKDKTDHVYQQGTLLSYSDHEGTVLAGGQTPASSVLVPTHNFAVVILLGDLAYTGQLGRHALPDTIIINDPVQVAIEGNTLWFLIDGKEYSAKISQRARYKKAPCEPQ
jgi:hypothetical protein